MTRPPLDRPIICLVTDRGRFQTAPEDALVSQVSAAAAAGVSLVQVRERDLPARSLLHLVRALVDAVSGTQAVVLVNDRADVAWAAGAHGVHLRSDSVAAPRLRAVAPAHWLIGRSVHSVGEARAVERTQGADYLFFGTVFPTASKRAGHPIAGIDALHEVCAAVRLPVIAIGGVTRANATAAAAAGAAGIAAIGLFSPGAGRIEGLADAAGEPPQDMRSLVGALRRAFDT